jgi:dTDP-4-amino-4,6-dideoxygalactose transaminase
VIRPDGRTSVRIAQPIIGPEEEAAVLRALRSGQLAQGKFVAGFEQAIADYLGVQHAVAVSSGTSALVVALQANGIGPGDEVIVPVFTFAATANAVLLAGATPVFVDIGAADFNIDVKQIEGAITPRTKVIIPVHLFGQPCDMSSLLELAGRRRLMVIEDACQALGARWQDAKAGTFGTGCLSFYATKGITTGEGGMIVTNDGEAAARARLLRNQGESVRYRTDVLGYNFRMTEMAAALGLAQLSKLDEWIECRRRNAAWLSERLEGVRTPVERQGALHIFQQYTVRVGSREGRLQPVGVARDAVQASLRAQDIESAVYYPLCLHQQPLYQQLGIGGSFPVAEQAAREVLSLPVHAALSQDDLERIVGAVNGALAGVGAQHG